MAKLILIHDGPCRDPALAQLEKKYLKQLSSWHQIQNLHYPASKVTKEEPALINRALKKEAEEIEKKINPKQPVILMTEHGRCHSTLDLAERFKVWTQQGSPQFIFGSAWGLDRGLFKNSRELLSLSPMTLTHEFSLVVWLEQLYRVSAILVGKRYHH